ncbi:hypothetical protein SARC_07845 [Sphaeroforma arctica JP610]|uniref:RGS domain-containing protein n=1 Tax=Sphaeroforma arctica JP610 TaxID=667725 RepID=A0A0L0FSJ9_9EUKA|nr:hypothetical protein SARC_07845 [Sphaeroforma arctica JP610]KNC79772.1 hypothetical protein SARC_07845 [Sphaeroforma arctica JP610]|eukprot:XP_014153674.1 hypothetical protein SARC_07845 [Sphaeroforma arctica JP610]
MEWSKREKDSIGKGVTDGARRVNDSGSDVLLFGVSDGPNTLDYYAGAQRAEAVTVDGAAREVKDTGAPSLAHMNSQNIVEYDDHRKKLWFGFCTVYAVFFGVTVVFVYLAMDRAPLISEQLNNGDYLFSLVLIANVPGLIMACLLCGFFYRFRNTPEVKSRRHAHLIHFCIVAILHPSARLLMAAVRFGQTPFRPTRPKDPNAAYHSWLLTGRLLQFFTAGSLLAAIVCRLVYMYLALRTESQGTKPRYWVLVVISFLWFIPCMLPMIWCNWHVCSMQKMFSSLYAYLGSLSIIYLILILKTRDAEKAFVDFHSNIRLFIAFCITFWIPVVWVNSSNTPTSFTFFSYFALFLGPYILWMFIIDSFALIIIRVTSRHLFRRRVLEDIDLEGEYYRRMECLGTNILQMVKDPGLFSLMLAHANSMEHLCGENLMFLEAINKCKQTEAKNSAQARHEWLTVVEEYIVIESVNEVNLVSRTRNKVLEHAHDEIAWTNVNWAARAAQMEVNYNLTQSWLPAFLKSEKYQKYRENQLKEVESLHNQIKRTSSNSGSSTNDSGYSRRENTQESGLVNIQDDEITNIASGSRRGSFPAGPSAIQEL